jgi:hypothetical protein
MRGELTVIQALQFLWATLFARGFATEMSVVEIFFGGLYSLRYC